MGDTISSLVFRPPKPTPIHQSEYFYLDVDVHSPLCTNKRHRDNFGRRGESCVDDVDGRCGGAMCLDTGESDLATLDNSYGVAGNKSENYNATNGNANDGNGINSNMGNGPQSAKSINNTDGNINNVRNGQEYKIPAFFIRRRNATQTLLFSHGNAEDLGMMYNRMKDLAMVLGVNIMAYDYTGYGLSVPGPAHGNGQGNTKNGGSDGGSNGNNKSNNNSDIEGPSENMIYRNIEAAFRYLTVVRHIPPHQIILYGRSLGSGPSCYLAAKSALEGASVGGLILHSPFLSVYKVVADLNGLDLGTFGDLFHNEKRARNVRCPTLIIHGKKDEVVPFWHAPRLLAAIPPEFRAQPYYVENMGHNHIESRCREQYVKVVLNFLRMGVWNNRNNVSINGGPEGSYTHRTNGGYRSGNGSPSNVPAYRGPSPIPINERASPSETKENASFYVNKTWLRHAKVLLKEVFADAGCYVNNTMDDNSSKYSQRTQHSHRRSASAGPTNGSNVTGSQRTVPSNNSSRYNRDHQGNLSDARDDEDEFAPWRQGNQRIRARSPGNAAAANMAMSENYNSGGYRAGASSEKILTTRRDTTNQNTNSQRGPAGTPRYRKAHSTMSMSTDRGGYFQDNMHLTSSSPRRLSQQKQYQHHPQPPQQQQPLHNSAPPTYSPTYSKSKSLQLMDGMNRPKRF